jgi:hypothetical protein
MEIRDLLFIFSPKTKKFVTELEYEGRVLSRRFGLITPQNNLFYVKDDESYSYDFSEIDNIQRFTRYTNALINYDYKTGNYVGY